MIDLKTLAVCLFSICIIFAFHFLNSALRDANNMILNDTKACNAVLEWLSGHHPLGFGNTSVGDVRSGVRDPQRRLVSEFIRATGYKPPGATDPSPFFSVDKHPGYDIVIDVGAYNCMDYTITGFKKGYTVFSFELNPDNVQLCLASFKAANFVEGKDYTVITVRPGHVPRVAVKTGTPHIYFFKAGVSNRLGGTSIQQGDVMTQVASTTGNVPLVRIDDVVPAKSRVYVFKSDTQGHEYGVFTGATNLLTHASIHLLAFEFWPQGARENGFNAKDLLDFLYDFGFQCFDAGVHGYDTVGRPSQIHAFTDFLDQLPRSADPIGAWEDLVCSRFTA